MPSRMYTVKTALAEYFQGALGETKFRELLKKGEIPHTRAGARILIREEALDAWMVEQEARFTRRDKPLRAVK